MLNLFTLAKQLFSGLSPAPDVGDCSIDPLSHPVVQRMTLEQLADLPFDRGPTSVGCCSAHAQEQAVSSRQ
jgi:hypothetical protein